MYLRSHPGGLATLEGVGFVDPVTASLIATGVTTAATAIIGWVNRRNQRKVAATQIVDEAERHLIANLDAFHDAPQTVANQQQALANFEQVWSVVLNGCGDPSLGDPGRRCISERQRGGEWDWFARYRDPIANAAVSEDPSLVSSFTSSVFTGGPGGSGGGGLMLPLAAGLLVLGVLL